MGRVIRTALPIAACLLASVPARPGDTGEPGLIVSRRASTDWTPTADPESPPWKGTAGVWADKDRMGKVVPGHRTEVRSRWTPGSLYLLFVCPYEQLHLKADQPGTFLGMSSHYSGAGFADMQFKVEALPTDAFSAWIDETRKGAAATLTSQAYRDLAKQSMNVAPFAYSAVEPDLFDKVVKQSLPPGPGPVVETSPGASKRGER